MNWKKYNKSEINFGQLTDLVEVTRNLKNYSSAIIFEVFKASANKDNVWYGATTEVAKLLGLSQSTMSKTINLLLSKKYIKTENIVLLDNNGKKGLGLKITVLK
jgi:DNA-binding MarR family transcriptional regulator